MRRGERKMLITIGGLILCIIIYLMIPYSPVKKEYNNTVKNLSESYKLSDGIITENDLKVLPETLQKYFIKNGYVGIGKASVVRLEFKDVDFLMSANKPNVKIDYTVNNFVKEPTRVALIDSKMYGIPFQGIDTSKGGNVSMKGVIAKNITLFNTSFDMIDSAYLAEAIMHPSLILQEDIKYKQIDDYTVEVTLSRYGREIKGTFHFNEKYEMTHFVDEERLCYL